MNNDVHNVTAPIAEDMALHAGNSKSRLGSGGRSKGDLSRQKAKTESYLSSAGATEIFSLLVNHFKVRLLVYLCWVDLS